MENEERKEEELLDWDSQDFDAMWNDYHDTSRSDDEIEKYNDAFGGGGHDYYYH